MINLFTYGSLMYSEVWQKIVTGQYQSQAASLSGFARYGVKSQSYPGIKPKSQAITSGLIYFNLNQADLGQLDRFEGDYYQRQTHLCKLITGQEIEADCYVLKPEFYSICNNQPWSVEKFEQSGIQAFLDEYNSQQ